MLCIIVLIVRWKGKSEQDRRGFFPNRFLGGKILCDVGANPDAKPKHLLQFAIMASMYLDHVEDIKETKVGLINIGEEPSKGSEMYLETHQLLDKELPNFIGNVESRNLFESEANVLVCDGFVGNTLIKFAEGWTTTFSNMIKDKIKDKIRYKAGAWLIKPALDDIQNKGRSYQVPNHLKDTHYQDAKAAYGYGVDYKYPHDYPENFVEQDYLPEPLKNRKYVDDSKIR